MGPVQSIVKVLKALKNSSDLSARRKNMGRWGEGVAEIFLRNAGYCILERNFRTRAGELDLIAQHGEVLVFVEVKARSNEDFGGPECSVDRRKQRRIIRMAKIYMARKGLQECPCRFDVVTVRKGVDGQADIRIIPNAFDADA